MVHGKGRFAHSGVHSAWFWKLKQDGAKAKWFGSAVRRYFTINFDEHTFAYCHSDADVFPVATLAFSEIMGATMPEDEAWAERAPKHIKRSISAVFIRHHGTADDEYVFIVHTRDRRLKLAADNREQASAWVSALNAAHLIGKGIAIRPPPSKTMDRRAPPLSPASSNSASSCAGSTTASGSTTVSSSDGEGESSTPISTKQPQDMASQQASNSDAGSAEADGGTCDGHTEEAPKGDQESAAAAPDREAKARAAADARLRASDFGFEEDEVIEVEPDTPVASPVATPRRSHDPPAAPAAPAAPAEGGAAGGEEAPRWAFKTSSSRAAPAALSHESHRPAADGEDSDDDVKAASFKARVAADLQLLTKKKTPGAPAGPTHRKGSCATQDQAQAARNEADLRLLDMKRQAKLARMSRAAESGSPPESDSRKGSPATADEVQAARVAMDLGLVKKAKVPSSGRLSRSMRSASEPRLVVPPNASRH
mmetsp:Transcript_120698/g.341962  ORF Transcript_120698/g.341962 Transcript_120698/m.341962 type:complete len:482 (-) Transcript_120698:248-1693(-)